MERASEVISAASSHIVEIGPMRPEECSTVAQLHYAFFGVGEEHGHSLARLGPQFLEEAFYRPNVGNPYFFVDVARYAGEIIAFSVYSSNHRRVFRHTLRTSLRSVLWAVLKSIVRHPYRTASKLLGNVVFLTEALPAEAQSIPGWFLLLGVKHPYRSREFQQRTGIWIAGAFKDRLERVLCEGGCKTYWAAPAADNAIANRFYEKIGATLFAQGPVQGMLSNYYRMSTEPAIEEK